MNLKFEGKKRELGEFLGYLKKILGGNKFEKSLKEVSKNILKKFRKKSDRTS